MVVCNTAGRFRCLLSFWPALFTITLLSLSLSTPLNVNNPFGYPIVLC